MNQYLLGFVAVVALASVLLSPRSVTPAGFFYARSETGRAPGLLSLVFSQVTTWIFARSLLNAAILGYYYGIWGTLAYTFYYLSFLTGGQIIDSLRFKHGFGSVQSFLNSRFGAWGAACYNLVISLRLLSEVFANLLVFGILFGVAGTGSYTLMVVLFAGVTLLYSLFGGLRASLRTDVFQMSVFLVLLVMLLVLVFGNDQFSLASLGFKPFVWSDPGPVLMLVALLQIWSYPMHDPVMMDRGFIADRDTTRRSFLHAAWLSMLCILAFGSLGVWAGALSAPGETMDEVLRSMLGELPMLLFSGALVVSAMSTLDSTLASAAKLVAVDMGLMHPTVRHGRMAMALFMLLGLLLVFLGDQDLFSAVAVSGTAALYLAPVVFFSLWGGRRDIPTWAYVGSFLLALAGALLYFSESAGHSQWLGEAHKYTKLLWISVVVLAGGCLQFWFGGRFTPRTVLEDSA